MRALVLTGPSRTGEHTVIREIDEPSPSPGEISVDVSHAGVNFKDVMQRRGDAEWTSSWPLVPGMEVAGTVRAVGEDVRSFTPGQRVCGLSGVGGLAQVATVRADRAVPVPDGVDLASAAAAPVVLATAHILLADFARPRDGDVVLVHSAAGGVGTAIARMAPALADVRLIGTVGSAGRIDAAVQAGYHVGAVRDDTLVAAVADAAPGGVDVILDPLGTGLLADNMAMAAVGGRIVLFGNAGGGDPALPELYQLLGANLAIAGMSITALLSREPGRVAHAIAHVLDLMAAARLDYPVTEIDLAQVPDVHQAMADGRGTGKYVARLR